MYDFEPEYYDLHLVNIESSLDYGYLSGINYESAADGPGVRAAIFLSGCNHHCLDCHNPETWDYEYGIKINEDMICSIAYNINQRPYLSGITLTGGDPLCSPTKTLNFLTTLKYYLGYLPNTWLYTGYEMKTINIPETPEGTDMKRLIQMCDVIVDGPFVKALADKRLAFRGSMNQKIIKVPFIRFKNKEEQEGRNSLCALKR